MPGVCLEGGCPETDVFGEFECSMWMSIDVRAECTCGRRLGVSDDFVRTRARVDVSLSGVGKRLSWTGVEGVEKKGKRASGSGGGGDVTPTRTAEGGRASVVDRRGSGQTKRKSAT